APEPGPPEEAVEFQPPEPGTGTATVARLTGPQADPAAASATTSPEFGFEPHEVEFEQQGVGREAASRLAKRFRWIKNLSAGGMGKIILVQEVLSGRFVAMKVMLAAAAANQGMVQQFVREAVITARLQHPHIIPVHDLGFLEGNQLYFTMSYIEGETLKTRMPALDPADRVRVLRCVALAAKHAHDRNLWHRDIKPQNVLVGELGDTYLIDWGIVSVQPGREYKLNIPKVVVDRLSYTIPDNLIRETNEAATGAGGVIGTPAYMAPEAIAGHERLMGAATDVWSVGVMLYEALTDRHPFMVPGMGHYEVMGAVQSETPQLVGELNPAAPSDLIALCDRMLRKNPHERIELPAAIGALTTHLNRNSHTLSITHLLSAHRPPPLTTDGRPQVLDLPRGTTELENELARTRRKCEILLELAQLGPLSIRRRKELWAQLVNL
ncbi:MAG: serine/threonine protein kinase, partial [Planctomycetes bacterium]|nr:serine/threonine protein kinase [Planctomycetota bacterium]